MSQVLTERDWSGMLTVENIDQVAERILRLLQGKRYTFVAFNEIFPDRLEVRTGMRLDPKDATNGIGVSVYRDESGNGDFAGFNVVDSYGVWGPTTTVKEDRYDDDFRNPYIYFKEDRVTIAHHAPAGHKLIWVAVIEKT